MKRIRCSMATMLVLATAVCADSDTQQHYLGVSSTAPRVEIARRSAARDYLRLPSLEYTFQLAARCAGDFTPQSVSLSIADSRKSLSADQLNNTNAGIELTVRVPAKQLAPLGIEGFCLKPANAVAQDNGGTEALSSYSKTVSAALSAQASLLCVHDEQHEIIYTSNPLDITLICASAEEKTE